jgi:hypothetical protein
MIAVVTATPASEAGGQWFAAFDNSRALGLLKGLGALFGREKLRYGILAVAAIIFLIWHQRRERSASVFLAAATLGITTFMYMRYPGSIWHHGVYFIVFLAAVWMGRSAAIASTQLLMVAVLIVAVSMTPRSVKREFSKPRSHARDVARFIEQSGWKNQPLIAISDHSGSSVVGYLGIDRAYYPEGGRWGSFVVWDNARKQMVDLQTALQATGVPATLVMTTNADVEGVEEAGFRRVVGFTEPWARMGESYIVYRRNPR